MAHAGLAIIDDQPLSAASDAGTPESIDVAMARAARLVHANDVSHGVPIVSAALAAALPGNCGWLLPVEPLVGVRHARDAWAPALAVLHLRALICWHHAELRGIRHLRPPTARPD
jgi:hypothetical protein